MVFLELDWFSIGFPPFSDGLPSFALLFILLLHWFSLAFPQFPWLFLVFYSSFSFFSAFPSFFLVLHGTWILPGLQSIILHGSCNDCFRNFELVHITRRAGGGLGGGRSTFPPMAFLHCNYLAHAVLLSYSRILHGLCMYLQYHWANLRHLPRYLAQRRWEDLHTVRPCLVVFVGFVLLPCCLGRCGRCGCCCCSCGRTNHRSQKQTIHRTHKIIESSRQGRSTSS